MGNCLNCGLFEGNGGGCEFVSSKQVSRSQNYGSSCEQWQPIKEDKVKYKLTEEYEDGFSLVDIGKECKTDCAKSHFIELLREYFDKGVCNLNLRALWWEWEQHITIQNNLPWLIEKNFIEEEGEEWVNLYYHQKMVNTLDMSPIHPTENRAIANVEKSWDYIKTIRIK